jgi:membrane dipeptidase
LDLLKLNGGIIMICFLPNLTNPEDNGKNAKLGQVIDHIIYAGTRIGYEHVGIGSDFDGMLKGPDGLDDVSCYPDLVAELLDRGVIEEDLIKVIGGNVIRVMGEVEKVSSRLKSTMPVLCDELEEVWTGEQKKMLVDMGKARGLDS